MMRNIQTESLSLPANLEFDETRTPRESAHKGEMLTGDHVYLGEARHVLDTELSWTLAVSTPLAVAGATFLAHSATGLSDIGFTLGIACIALVVFFQIRVRRRVVSMVRRLAREQGLSRATGRRDARDYLRSWFR